MKAGFHPNDKFKAGEIKPLVVIVNQAGQRQILRDGDSLVFRGDHVVNLVGQSVEPRDS